MHQVDAVIASGKRLIRLCDGKIRFDLTIMICGNAITPRIPGIVKKK